MVFSYKEVLMNLIKLSSIYYVKYHDRNIPGDDGWKVESEVKSPKIKDIFLYPWCDKFLVYERILQDVTTDSGRKVVLSEPIGVKEFTIERIDNHFVAVMVEDEKE